MDLNKIIGGKPSLKRLLNKQAAQSVENKKTNFVENLTFTKVWGKLLIELRADRYRALYGEASLVESGKIEGTTLKIIAPKFSVNVLNNQENKEILENTIFKIFGIHFNLVIAEKPEIKDPNIDKLKKLFGKKLKIVE